MHEDVTVVVEKENGERAVVKALRSTRRRRREKTEADYEAFRSAAGGWKDVDTDKLIEDVYADRRISDRPPVEL
jgi:hypothetical protein